MHCGTSRRLALASFTTTPCPCAIPCCTLHRLAGTAAAEVVAILHPRSRATTSSLHPFAVAAIDLERCRRITIHAPRRVRTTRTTCLARSFGVHPLGVILLLRGAFLQVLKRHALGHRSIWRGR